MDIVYFRGLKVATVIGIYDWEREQKQTLIFDIEMGTDTRQAAASDAIEHALDYKAISDRVIDFVAQSDCYLVERLIEEVAQLIQREFSVPWVRINLNKQGAIGPGIDVGVTITRGQWQS
ncbi:MAG: dihydroneopterin aldolase [Methylococcales bacterium]|nr:dihydroneopterin aldolase [Methylococcales bacterium]